MTELNWGLLGTGRIASMEMGPAIVAARRSRLAAVASRESSRARELADRLGAGRAYGSYEELLADPRVDAVYIALPNSLHREWTLAALAAGKHVLCEKPLGLSASEVRDISAAATATGLVVMEAFMWRFHPRTRRAQELVDSGSIGEVQSIQTSYTVLSQAIADPAQAATSIRFKPELGGGALGDLGCYCIDGLRLFAGSPPVEVSSRRTGWPGTDVETTTWGEMRFANGTIGQFFASMEGAGGTHIEVIGTTGRLRLQTAFRLPPTLETVTLEVTTDGETTTETFPNLNQYRLEAEHFASLVLDGESPRIPLADSLENALALDAVRRSWATVGSAPVRLLDAGS